MFSTCIGNALLSPAPDCVYEESRLWYRIQDLDLGLVKITKPIGKLTGCEKKIIYCSPVFQPRLYIARVLFSVGDAFCLIIYRNYIYIYTCMLRTIFCGRFKDHIHVQTDMLMFLVPLIHSKVNKVNCKQSLSYIWVQSDFIHIICIYHIGCFSRNFPWSDRINPHLIAPFFNDPKALFVW